MKYFLSILAILLFSFLSFPDTFSATNGIFNNTTPKIPYDNQDLGLEAGVNYVKNVDGVVSNITASAYIQKIVKFLLTFLTIIGTIMIIYAGFNLLTGAGDEEAAKKSKSIILYSIIGIMIIFLAGPIIDFVLKVLN